MVTSLSSSLAQSLLPQSSSSALIAAVSGGGTLSSGPVSAASVQGALRQAEKNEARQLEITARTPDVQRAVARYATVVKQAKSIDDIIDDPTARRVLMTASGLSGQQDFVGLIKKALKSDPKDPNSLISRLGSANQAWLDLANTYKFKETGVARVKTELAIKQVTAAYVGERRLDLLDQQLPGLGSAVLFKRIASRLDSPLKILGDTLAREVVTKALGLPQQMAVQSLQAQEKAISQRLDVRRLKDPEYVDRIAQRYLQQINGGSSGVLA